MTFAVVRFRAGYSQPGLTTAAFKSMCVHGYRPNKGALDAVDRLTIKLQFGRYHFVVEADIQGFFDNLNHENLVEMLSWRIGDRQLLRLIRKWLKAGVLETSTSEEPGARKGHAGIWCRGGSGNWPSYRDGRRSSHVSVRESQ